MINSLYNGCVKQNATIDNLVQNFVKKVALLERLEQSSSLESYTADVWKWKADKQYFPYQDQLKAVIIEKMRRCYGEESSQDILKQLDRHFVVETGAHLSLPRDLDRVGKVSDANKNMNTLVFQGALYMAALQLKQGNQYNISISSSRIPVNNANSGKYFQPTSDESLVSILMPNKYNACPQALISSMAIEYIDQQRKTLEKQKLSLEEKARVNTVFDIFKNIDSGFSDQISVAHSHLMSEVFQNTGIKQATVGLDLTWDFIADLLDDPQSLLHRIFSDEKIRNDFITALSDIPTGWKKGQSPFDQIIERKGLKIIGDCYEGSLEPKIISKKIKDRDIIPKGLLEFMTIIVEGGLLPLGGMYQVSYCSEIRDRMADWLEKNEDKQRAEALRAMPVHVATLSPAWGIKKKDNGPSELMSYSDVLSGQLKIEKDTLMNILNITGRDSFLASLLVLHDFLEEDLNKHLTEQQKEQIVSCLHDSSILHFDSVKPQKSIVSFKKNVIN